MTTLCSYDLNGKQLSFANWISNLSPQETPFVSMTGKESINQTLFQWQTDTLAKAGENAVAEGATATEGNMRSTTVKQNITQILRKVVKVSDTANALANYGRGKELQYQMEKAGKELKRDLEWAFLHNQGSKQETATTGRETAGFHGLVAPSGATCADTGAIVHFDTAANTIKEEDIFKMTYNLYLAGSSANIIMFHPKHASVFSSLQEKATTRMRIFEDTPKFSVYVSTIVDPLGQEYKLIPNRWMPEHCIYFFNPSDWTQMVLRAPNRTKLAKDGSYEKWMLEMEVGLRHRNPYASGILGIKTVNKTHDVTDAKTHKLLDNSAATVKFVVGSVDQSDVATLAASTTHVAAIGKVGDKLAVKIKTGAANPQRIQVLKDGNEVLSKSGTGAQDHSTNALIITGGLTMADSGNYTIRVIGTDNSVEHSYETHAFQLSVKQGDNGNVVAPVAAKKGSAKTAE